MAELKRQGSDLYRHLASQIMQNKDDPTALTRLARELQGEADQQDQQSQQGQQNRQQQGQQQPDQQRK